MKKYLITFAAFATAVSGQILPQRASEADLKITNEQAGEIFKSLRAVAGEARKSVLPLFANRQRICYGISIGDGKVLAKASEVVAQDVVYTISADRKALAVEFVGVYSEHDLIVLKVPGLKAPAAKWADAGNLEEGSFLTAIRPDGEAQAMGVLSVQERSLKVTDQGFLGIQMDPREVGKGVRVDAVVRRSAAADAGIRSNDLIVKIDDEEVKGFYELSTKLRRLRAGEKPTILIDRGGQELTVTPTLRGREIAEGQSGRIDRMDKMSGSQSRVRGEFGNVLQSDMELEVNDAGLPVVDLEGRIVGMVIARAGRISTLILPGDDIAKVLEVEPKDFVRPQRRMARRRGGDLRQNRRQRMQDELDQMRRLMERLQRELDRE